ncbi:hypothetical protein B296_00055636 [Ensete ventricosum]|uniref:Uncharacterized protein n=1 Tax=Ensete ventricosum TaxID=4639 RepID=A0A426XYT8_ENSVE|nr:hypothetical protein B296_00055636 [Ensete ventricosum]
MQSGHVQETEEGLWSLRDETFIESDAPSSSLLLNAVATCAFVAWWGWGASSTSRPTSRRHRPFYFALLCLPACSFAVCLCAWGREKKKKKRGSSRLTC